MLSESVKVGEAGNNHDEQSKAGVRRSAGLPERIYVGRVLLSRPEIADYRMMRRP